MFAIDMRTEKTLFRCHLFEVKTIPIRSDESSYRTPKFFYNKICNWFRIFGFKFLTHVYYIVIF